MGYAGSMDGWDPIFLKGLSRNHTVIVFDNRGIGNTTIGSKNFTIDQFAWIVQHYWTLLIFQNQIY
jgi:pimeloyl-ACP methyl ester carboxylesterase